MNFAVGQRVTYYARNTEMGRPHYEAEILEMKSSKVRIKYATLDDGIVESVVDLKSLGTNQMELI